MRAHYNESETSSYHTSGNDKKAIHTRSGTKISDKVVLLMREKAFRKGKLVYGNVDINNKDEIDKLKKLIDYFQKIKADFKTLKNY